MCKLCDNIDNYTANPRIETFCKTFLYVVEYELGCDYNYFNGETSNEINFCPECGKDLYENFHG